MNFIRTFFDELLNFGKSRYEINVWAVSIINVWAVSIINVWAVSGKQSTGLFSTDRPYKKITTARTENIMTAVHGKQLK